MKKIIAMILALATTASLAVSAMADTNNNAPVVDSNPGNNITFETGTNDVDLSKSPVLTPGKTYYFPVRLNDKALDATQYGNLKFTFVNEEGKRSIASIKLERYKSDYQLAVRTTAGWPTTLTDVSYTVKVTDSKGNIKDIAAPALKFQVGYKTIADHLLDNPEYVAVSPDAPVITEDQFDLLHDIADGKEVTFGDSDWEYTVRVNGMKTTNMLSNYDEVDLIVDKFSDNQFKFVSFPAGPEFRSVGTLSIDVSDEMDDFSGKFFVYRYLNGKLTKVDASLNNDAERITIKTKELGRFVITDKEIKDNTIVDNNFGGSSNSGSSDSEKNPDTGANDFVGLAVAMAVVATAGIAVASKKRK